MREHLKKLPFNGLISLGEGESGVCFVRACVCFLFLSLGSFDGRERYSEKEKECVCDYLFRSVMVWRERMKKL